MEKTDNTCCFSLTPSSLSSLLFVGIIILLVLRVFYVLYQSGQPRHAKSSWQSFNTLIVLGSGGHTAEMLNLLSVLEMNRFQPRHYIAAATDNMSLQKAKVFENSLHQKGGNEGVGTAQFLQIYRSREVGQSYLTSVGTTLIALAHALLLMIKIRPEVILCNCPGTCVPLCVIAFLFKHCESEDSIFECSVSVQAAYSGSVICAMAATKKQISSSSLRGLPYVAVSFHVVPHKVTKSNTCCFPDHSVILTLASRLRPSLKPPWKQPMSYTSHSSHSAS